MVGYGNIRLVEF